MGPGRRCRASLHADGTDRGRRARHRRRRAGGVSCEPRMSSALPLRMGCRKDWSRDLQARASTWRHVLAACASRPMSSTTKPTPTASSRLWPGGSGISSEAALPCDCWRDCLIGSARPSCPAFVRRGAQQLPHCRLSPPRRPCGGSNPPAHAQGRLFCHPRPADRLTLVFQDFDTSTIPNLVRAHPRSENQHTSPHLPQLWCPANTGGTTADFQRV